MMMRLPRCLLYAALVLGGVGAAMALPVAAQDFAGTRGPLSMPQWLSWRHASQLPVRVLLADTTFSATHLRPAYTRGPLRTYQHPSASRGVSFASHGLTTYKGLRLEGRFHYQKEREDDVGWKLGRQVYQRPYYFANIRPGNWDRDSYTLTLHGGTALFGDRLLAAVGTDYRIERLARFNDPRPRISYYDLFVKAQLGWRYEQHTLALYAGTGDADETGSVRNYNRANDSFGARAYNIITTTGLGSYNLVRYTAYEKPTTRTDRGLTYRFDGAAWQFTSELVWSRSQSAFERRISRSREHLGTYHEASIRGTAFVTLPRPSYTLQVRSMTRHTDGYDQNQAFAGANYFRTGWQQRLDLFVHSRSQRASLQATLAYSDQSFTDRNASHHYAYAWLAPGLSAQVSRSIGAWRVAVIPGVAYQRPLSHTARIPAQNRNLHTAYVLAPDYYLQTADIVRLRGAVHVIQQFDGVSVGLLIDYRRQVRLGGGAVVGAPPFLPGDTRDTIALTLQFFH